MAGFKAHMTGSTMVGIGYAAAGYALGIPLPTSILGGCLCSLSGMLPDLDSGSGKPVREMTGFAAAVIPALMIPRFQRIGWTPEQMVLAAIAIYVTIRFGVAYGFRKYTVHRGMWHSIPAAAVVGLLALLLVSGDEIAIKLFKAGGIVAGFMTHLVMDELWSIDTSGARIRLKKSFGTALKFWNKGNLWSNVSTYAKLVVLIAMVIGDPYLMNELGVEHRRLPQSPSEWMAMAASESKLLWEKVKSGQLVTEVREESRGLLSDAWKRVQRGQERRTWDLSEPDIMPGADSFGISAEPGQWIDPPLASPIDAMPDDAAGTFIPETATRTEFPPLADPANVR